MLCANHIGCGHLSQRLVAEVSQELRSSGVDVWRFELKYDLQRVPLSARVREQDEIGRSANRKPLPPLALGEIMRRVGNLPLWPPLHLTFWSA